MSDHKDPQELDVAVHVCNVGLNKRRLPVQSKTAGLLCVYVRMLSVYVYWLP